MKRNQVLLLIAVILLIAVAAFYYAQVWLPAQGQAALLGS